MTPVISKSTATKSASRRRPRRSLRADSKFDLVTFLISNEEDEESARRRVVKTVVGAWDNWRVVDKDFHIHSFFILCLVLRDFAFVASG